MCKIIFLGGVPGVGKTTIAYKLALKYHIDKVISLDVFKTMLKSYSNDPYVNTTTHEAYKIENLSVVEGFKKHCQIINNYYYQMLKKFNEHAIIVEGATVTTEFVQMFKDNEYIYINLSVRDKNILLNRYDEKLKMRKGKWKDNIENILKINEYLQNQSTINIEINDIDNKTEEVLNESLFLQ